MHAWATVSHQVDYKQEIDELSVNNFKIEVITPDEDWLRASSYLNHKFILKLER